MGHEPMKDKDHPINIENVLHKPEEDTLEDIPTQNSEANEVRGIGS